MKSELKIDGPSVVHIESSAEVTVSVTPVIVEKMHTGILEAAINSAVFSDTDEFVRRMKAIRDLVDFQLI